MKTPIIYQDNTSAIAAIKNSDYVHSNKYIHARTENLKSFYGHGDFLIEHLSTKLMLADIFTKPLNGSVFIQMRNKLLGMDSGKV